MESACSTYGRGKERNTYEIFVEKLEGRRPRGRPRRKWEDNIKLDHREIGWGVMDWVNLAQDRDQCRALVNMVMINEPAGSIQC
jgi:hypothetical protein